MTQGFIASAVCRYSKLKVLDYKKLAASATFWKAISDHCAAKVATLVVPDLLHCPGRTRKWSEFVDKSEEQCPGCDLYMIEYAYVDSDTVRNCFRAHANCRLHYVCVNRNQ